MRLRLISCAIVLSSIGCVSAPKMPAIWQCGYSAVYAKFQCCNTDTGECVKRLLYDPDMEGAQCLSAPDQSIQDHWTLELIKLSERRIK